MVLWERDDHMNGRAATCESINSMHNTKELRTHATGTISILLGVLGRHDFKNMKTVNARMMPTGLIGSAAPVRLLP